MGLKWLNSFRTDVTFHSPHVSCTYIQTCMSAQMEVHFSVILIYSKHKLLETLTLKLCKIWDIPISKQRHYWKRVLKFLDLMLTFAGIAGVNLFQALSFFTGMSNICLTDLSISKQESTGTWDRIGHHHPFKCATAILNLLIYD